MFVESLLPDFQVVGKNVFGGKGRRFYAVLAQRPRCSCNRPQLEEIDGSADAGPRGILVGRAPVEAPTVMLGEPAAPGAVNRGHALAVKVVNYHARLVVELPSVLYAPEFTCTASEDRAKHS